MIEELHWQLSSCEESKKKDVTVCLSESWRHVRPWQWTSHVASYLKRHQHQLLLASLHCFVSAVFNASKNTLSSQLITDSWDTNRNTRRGEFTNCRRKYVLSWVILCSRKYRKVKKKKKVTLPGEWPFRCRSRVVMHR